MSRFPESRKVLLQERDEARADTRKKATFCSFRLNVPSGDTSTMLLTVADWQAVMRRPVEREPMLPPSGWIWDLLGSWSAACAMFSTHRVEAVAVTPGIPSLGDQEKRDRVSPGTYRRLHEQGSLRIAEGLRVVPPAQLVDFVTAKWGRPLFVVADRARENEMRDAAPHWQIDARATLPFEASADIRALRRMAMDGPLSVDQESCGLITESLAVSTVKNDGMGGTRLTKRDFNQCSRDDVAFALTLLCGAVARHQPWRVDETPVRSGSVRSR